MDGKYVHYNILMIVSQWWIIYGVINLSRNGGPVQSILNVLIYCCRISKIHVAVPAKVEALQK